MPTDPLHVRFGAILIIVFFGALLLPILPSASTYHEDESFYTDATITMVQTGDFLSPYYSDGSLRTDKPILAYWALALSYKLFGISMFSSRLPFLCAGCGVLWMTYLMSLRLFRRGETALLATAIMCSNYTFLSSSLRSTPDILLTLFLCTSLYGFINILLYKEMSLMNYAFAYIGAALAIETKGLLGIAPIIFAFTVCVVRRNLGLRLRDMFNGQIVFAAAGVASFWYIAIYLKHGYPALHGFFSDQVGTRFEGSEFRWIQNVVVYIWGLLRHFFPWDLFIVVAVIFERKRAIIFFREYREICFFIIGWYLLFVLLFINGNLNRTRYMLPAYPMVSIFAASMLIEIFQYGRTMPVFLGRINKSIMVLGTLASLVLICAGFLFDVTIAEGGIILFLGSTLFYALSVKAKKVPVFVTLGMLILVIFSVDQTFIYPVFKPSPAPQIAECILRESAGGKITVLSLDLKDKYAGQIRVLSGGRIHVENHSSVRKPWEFDSEWVLSGDRIRLMNYLTFPQRRGKGVRASIIFPESSRRALDLSGYRIERCGYALESPKVADIGGIIGSGSRNVAFDRLKTYYLFAVAEDVRS